MRSRTLDAFGGNAVACLLLFTVSSGCSVRASRFQIIDYRESGEPKRYRETFDEAYYAIDEHRNVDVVVRRVTLSRSLPRHTITQVIHMRSVWRPIPGETVAHRTQVNALVAYRIVAGRTGAGFEGAGSIFFRQNRKNDILTGTLDLATLRPTRRLADSHELFVRAELMGEFHAKRDRARVVRIINEMNRLFGPSPPPETVGVP